MFKKVNVTTRENTYETPPGDQTKGKDANHPSNSTPPNPFYIDNLIYDVTLCLPNSIIQKATFNPNSCVAQNYNIIEDLAQEPCDMLTLEFLQHCPSQCRTMLSAIGDMDPDESNLITFNMDYFKEKVSHHLAFQIQVLVGGKNIHRTILDEGASTNIMYFPCWRALGSPILTTSPTTLKSFNGHGFQPNELLQSFIVNLKGNNVSVDIEVVNAHWTIICYLVVVGFMR
jgi:hypothetical protein